MKRRIVVVLTCALAVAALSAGGAQTPQQRPVFRSGAIFVNVDAYPRKDGKVVENLNKSDFEIFEDGKPQAVETFRLIKVDAVAPEYTTRAIRTREDEETAAADENARIFVFFLDDYNVRQNTAMAVRKPVSEFIRTQLAPNDLVAVMYPLTPLDGVVLDVLATLRRAAERAVGLGIPPGSVLVDPTHDFGKNTWHSLHLVRRTQALVALGHPVLMALSRKDFVGETLDLAPEERLEGTLAATSVGSMSVPKMVKLMTGTQTFSCPSCVHASLGVGSRMVTLEERGSSPFFTRPPRTETSAPGS